MALLPQDPIKRTLSISGLVIVGMFAFGFLLVPLYDVFCEITGLNGKTAGKYEEPIEMVVDDSRMVTVQFISHIENGMAWEFKPAVHEVKVHPGEPMVISYKAKNNTGKHMIGQAIPSLVPNAAVAMFHKTECFCFEEQPLDGGEEAELALQFIVDPELPESVKQITLSYTLYDRTDEQVAAR
ncbi:MAG: cytochrome c oxidase assembly protein [Cellvibrionaceae bacterium]